MLNLSKSVERNECVKCTVFIKVMSEMKSAVESGGQSGLHFSPRVILFPIRFLVSPSGSDPLLPPPPPP